MAAANLAGRAGRGLRGGAWGEAGRSRAAVEPTNPSSEWRLGALNPGDEG